MVSSLVEGSATCLPALAILGPTASGKTGLAINLAQQGYPIEIISLDSALVYRHMNIGTAKPTVEEREGVPHHLIDIIEPTDVFNASDFVDACLRLIQEIRQRGNVPLIVGGTMMYFKTLVSGMDDMPAKDERIRQQIETEAILKGWPYMHDKLAGFDPVTASRLKPNDSQRIERAIEVYMLTGTPLSSFHQRQGSPIRSLSTLALEPANRAFLHERIALRFDTMLREGFIQEVEELRRCFSLSPDLPSMRCVGYRQVWEYLDGQVDLQACREKGIAATRQLAKRQITWLRSTKSKHVLDPFEPDWMSEAKMWFERSVATIL